MLRGHWTGGYGNRGLRGWFSQLSLAPVPKSSIYIKSRRVYCDYISVPTLPDSTSIAESR